MSIEEQYKWKLVLEHMCNWDDSMKIMLTLLAGGDANAKD